MSERWIGARCGVVDEAKAKDMIREDVAANDRTCCAFFTDSFRAFSFTEEREKRLNVLLEGLSRLLEVRLFNEKSELWLHRTAIGAPFAWRLADDKALEASLREEKDPFLRRMDSHRMESVQLLDTDAAFEGGEDDCGAKKLRATGGGAFSLPIRDGENAVAVVSYIRYDENGAASIADYRLAGFAREEDRREEL